MRIVKGLSILLTLLLSIVLISCVDQTTDEVKVTNIQLQGLSGQGTLASPYLVDLKEGASKEASIGVTPTNATDYDLEFTLGTLANGVFTAGSVDGISLKSDNSKTKLSLTATKEGTYAVKISLKGGVLAVYVSVNVTKDTVVEDVLVSGISFPTIDAGNGSKLDPYKVEIPYTQTANYSFAVSPSNAKDKSFTFEQVKKVGDDFVSYGESETKPLEVTYTANRVTITALESGLTAYVKGTSNDASNVEVYLEVEIAEFHAVTEITVGNILPGEETTYFFKTAKGTTWDMSGDELARKAGLMNGTQGPGAGQAVNNLTYWPSLYVMPITVAPEHASNPQLLIESSDPTIFTLSLDGTYEAKQAGEVLITISSVSNPDVKVTINVEVVDTMYPGILTSAFEAKETSALNEWNFDGNPDNLGSRPLLEEWMNVFMQTNSRRGDTHDDGNQKIFYLGQPDRVYGIALEGRVNNNRGNLSVPTSMVWNKVAISPIATTIDLVIGNNDKVHGQYRVVLVDETGAVYIVKDWTDLSTPNTSSRVNDLVIPEGAKGKTVAFVIEHRLKEKENNAELHLKGIWINQFTPVTSLNVPVSEGTFGQGATFKIEASVNPANATNKGLIFTSSHEGISVTNEGNVTIGLDVPQGEYTIEIKSADNEAITEIFTITVDVNVPVTSFDIVGFENGKTYQATYDESTGVNHTDTNVQLGIIFNEGASDQTFIRTVSGTSVEVSETGMVRFVGLGSSVVKLTPNGNPSLAVEFTIEVVAYSLESLIAPEVFINKTEANNTLTSSLTEWNTQQTVRSEWRAENVNKNHGGSKVADYGDNEGRIVLEGHSTQANFQQPINIIWNKVHISETTNSFKFLVRNHDDDRVLESTNFRVKLITLGEEQTVHTLIDWTTIASRWKQGHHWFEVVLDVAAYKNQDVIILIEQTGSLQNNGEWAKYSDSGAGAYLHIKGFELSTEVAPALAENYRYYAAFNKSLQANLPAGLTIVNNPYENGANVFNPDGSVNEMVVEFSGSYGTTLELSTTTPFINNGSSLEPHFYLWGLFPALNNSHQNNEVVYELDSNPTLSLTGNTLTFVAAGTQKLTVKYLAFGSTTEYVSLEVTFLVK